MLKGPQADTERFRASVGQHFRAERLDTLLGRVASSDPIAISRIVAPAGQTRPTHPTAAYSIPIVLAPLSRMSVCIDGVRTDLPGLRAGDIMLVDLRADTWSLTAEPYSFLRVQLSQRTIDDLAYERGLRAPSSLQTVIGKRDLVLHELAKALMAWTDIYGSGDCLFADHVALAFHAHIVRTYGQGDNDRLLRGGLAPWQLRRAREMMLANLAGGVTIAELGEMCGLSTSYFARAFRQATGVPPHKWLMAERVRRAKHLLQYSDLALADVAAACGFADQSHMTRVFASTEGRSPGRWRRLAID